MFKKEFQKTIAAIRKELGSDEYPKAMCTGAQYAKRTATVNCGGEWRPKSSPETAKQVMQHPKFAALLKAHDAKAVYEQGRYGDRCWTQIRIYFAE
jgi:hypothetical protein